MPDHFTDIGFKVDRSEDIEPLVMKAATHGRRMRSPGGWYSVWTPGRGIEMWVAMENSGHILGCNPYFEGVGKMRFRVEGVATNPPVYAPPLEGGLRGWADASPEDPKSGLCPLLVDLPDFDLQRSRLRFPSNVTLRVAAFTDWLKCYGNDSEFDAAQEGEVRHKYASEFFIPSGLFTQGEEPNRAARAYATFAGHVRELRSIENPDTNLRFHHLVVKTAAGILDVVTDPAAVVTGQPIKDGVVMGEFWLSGKILGL